jgi:hypothetical protein
MGVLTFGLGIGGLLAFGLGQVIVGLAQRFGQPSKRASWIGIVTMCIAMAFFGPLMMYAMISVLTIEKMGVGPPDSDRILAKWKVPGGAATDLCYYRSARLSEYFDFQISEADFLQWMKANGWKPQRYAFQNEWEQTHWTFNGRPEDAGCDVYPRRGRADEASSHYVLDGYCYHERFIERAEGFITIIYDVKEGRAYVESPN